MSEIVYPEIHGHIVRIVCGPAIAARVRELLPEVQVDERADIIGDSWWGYTYRGPPTPIEGAGVDGFEPEPEEGDKRRTLDPEAFHARERERAAARAAWNAVAPTIRLPAPPVDGGEPTP